MTGHALAEVQAVLRDACRGIGQPAALGEELALSVGMAPPDFCHWGELEAVFAEPVSSGFGDGKGLHRCLIDGPSLVDAALMEDCPIEIAALDAPRILELYLLRAALAFDCGFQFDESGASGWTISRQEAGNCSVQEGGRVSWPDGLYEHLQTLARRTHVPATEGTRLSGAGAGLNDND